MKFYIRRTSTRYDDEPDRPCEGAEYIPENIVPDTDHPAVWEIKIGNIDELLHLIKAEGKIVLSYHKPSNSFTIEIYDTWRE